MSLFEEEVGRVQNAAYGAILVHSLASGYQNAHATHAALPLPYVFAAMPCLFNLEILHAITHTKRSLRAVVDKLTSAEGSGSDVILSIPRRATEMRPFTLECISVLVASRLAALDIANATITPLREEVVTGRPERPVEADAAYKLGSWLAALSTFEISSLLKVTF